MADRDPRGRPRSAHTTMSARKSAPVRAGGVNVRRLELARAAREQQQQEQEEQETPTNQCGNPFCRAVLANRYARFCEDKAMCQRYRALRLQCAANAQAKEDEEDTRPLSLAVKKKKKKMEKEEEEKEFEIPRRKSEKRRREDGEKTLLKKQKKEEAEEQAKRQREQEDEEKRRQKKKLKKKREAAQEEESLVGRVKRRKDALRRSKTSSDAENGTGTAAGKKRRLHRRVSADDVLSRSASSSPVKAAAAADANWTIPRAKPGRPKKTAAQAIRSMNVELVPLGVASQANLAGGGRYVQNGNRSAPQAGASSGLRAKPPRLTKFTSPSVPASSIATTARPPHVPLPTASSRPMQTTRPTIPTPPLAQTQPPLPPLPPASSTPSVPRPGEPARAVTPSSSPVRAVAAQANPSTRGATPSGVTRTRISTSDYLKKRKEQPSRSSSLERSSSLADDRTSGYPPASAAMNYPPRPSGFQRTNSAPLPASSSDFRPRDPRLSLDPRRQYPEAEAQFRLQQFNDNDGPRLDYRDRSESRGEVLGNDAYASGRWEGHSFPPPPGRYPPRQQERASTSNGGYDYGADTHFSPEASPAEQPYWRESLRETTPPPQRAPSPRRSEPGRVNIAKRNSDEAADQDDDTPTFSYHESFLPRLLSIFIYKLPHALEAVFNVTKKPRKMNWYIKYVERIERLCQPYDLRVKFDGLKAVVTVRDRVWLTIQGQSTVTLHLDVIKSLRAEAMTWLQYYEEMKKALAHYRSMYGDQAKESFSFLRAWNDLKTQGNNLSLSRQANYFCGARLHHWSFVVGKVEIGSGSHEEKREAFRLATESALDFLLSIGGERRPKAEYKRDRVSDADRLSSRGRRRSSSRESSTSRLRTAPADEQADGASAATSSSAGQPSSVSLSSTYDIRAVNTAPVSELQVSTREPQSSAEPSSSPVTVDRTTTSTVAIIPAADSNSSNEPADAAEQSDLGEEMSISDASETSALTPAGSPVMPIPVSDNNSAGVTHTTASGSTAAPAASMTPALATPSTITSVAEEPSIGTAHSKPVTTPAASAASAGSPAAAKDTPVSQTTAKVPIPPRRCMMCEMIRMRKPDGERCLRCQQKDEPANGVLGP